MTDALYINRRERLIIQVVSRWTGKDYNDDAAINARAIAAANAAFMANQRMNDLDWEAATLRRLGYTGAVL